MNDNQIISFLLEEIKIEQFATFDDHYKLDENIGMNTEFQFKSGANTKHIGVFFGIEFIQEKNVLIKLEVSCHFKIEEESWNNFLKNNDNTLVIPKALVIHLAMITVGTSRGILFAKTEGTPVAKFIIPTLNLVDIIKDDAIFPLD